MKISQIAELLKCKAIIRKDKDIISIAPIEKAQEGGLSFLSNKKYEKYLNSTKASCIIAYPQVDTNKYASLNFIVCDNPYLAFAKILRFLFKQPKPEPFISKNTQINKTAKIDKTARIEDFVFIGKDVKIGKHTKIMPFVFIGDNVTIGDNCLIYPNVTIREKSIIGNNVIIHSGVVIGSDGFGYADAEDGVHLKIPQIGNVVIEDDVEIGANTTIDRAALESTVIRKGTKMDNLVQIGHNVEIGQNSIIVAQSGVSGSTKVGKNVIMAGQTGLAGHLKITDDVIITAKSGVGKSIRKPGVYSGIPVFDHKDWLKSSAVMPKLHEMYKTIKELQKEVEELKNAVSRRD